eukprot:jgi/Galph1/5782/GphlegSOOS_G4443.1
MENLKIANDVEKNIISEELNSDKRVIKVKVPKGTRDFLPEQMAIREKAFGIVTNVFERHGAVAIDTPVFELKETLTGKYGEDSKLIYDLADQGGELLSLRYDLTVPLARYIATHKISNLKRYHISRVYRRDNPAMQRGRFREFYQCDFDIAGVFSKMVTDAEVVKVLCEILNDLASVSSFHSKALSSYKIKVSHRGLLMAIFELCGVPKDKVRSISSAVDKLDKETWTNVKQEMVQQKGLDSHIAERIGFYVLQKDTPWEMLHSLRQDSALQSIASAYLDEMEMLFKYLDAFGVIDKLLFDLSLARGLDYYTGLIFEAVLTDGVSSLGSIGAGGRYDNLVGMFTNRQTAEKELAASMSRKIKSNKTQVYVASIGENMIAERMRLTKELWTANIAAEFSYAERPKFNKQLQHVLEEDIPIMVIVGEDELSKGVVKIKTLLNNEQREVERKDMIAEVCLILEQWKETNNNSLLK